MNKIFSYLLFFTFLLGGAQRARANHIFGGDLLYTNYLNDSTYIIKLTLYADCKATASLITDLYTSTPIIYFYNGSTMLDSFVVKLQAGSGMDVSPVCPAMVSQTACNISGTLPGVRQFIYLDTIHFPEKSANLNFVFKGHLNAPWNISAGRSANITNLEGPATSLLQLTAHLNNLNAPNSSPAFSTIPTPFYCVNVPEEYNQGAVDPNGDSLAFALVSAVDGSTGADVSYISPCTPSAPLLITGGSFLFNPLNGQVSFKTGSQQDASVVNQVSEYRGGVLVGTSQREMAFIVQDGCSGNPPVVTLTNVVGAAVTNGTVINICRNTPHVSFDISIANPDGDTIFVTPTGVPSSATLIISNDSTPSPSGSFSWNTATLATGVYSFFLTVKDDHCPLASTQTIAYTINVADVPQIAATQLSSTQCIHQALVSFYLIGGFMPRTVTVLDGSSVVATLTDTAGTAAGSTLTDSLPGGTYTVIVSSDSACSTSISFTVADSGSLPDVPLHMNICQYAPSQAIDIAPVAPGATFSWFDADGTPLAGPPTPNTFSAANYVYYYTEQYKVCNSGPDSVYVTVHPPPLVSILNIPQTICYGDKIYLHATGGVSYVWEPVDVVKSDTGGQYVETLDPVSLTVVAMDAVGCVDSAAISFSDIQPCCNFSYPNAFTPNNDGGNDGFKIVTWGNMREFSLSIYNRWGQRVFWTSDPDKRWDGTFQGTLCEIGVYFYIMNAECLTGRKETHKGDVLLIR